MINKKKIILHGGIGSQIIRLLMGVGAAIKYKVKPSELKIIRILYDNSIRDRKMLYHNQEDIRSYLDINPAIEYEIEKDRSKYATIKFNSQTIELLALTINNDYVKKYICLKKSMERDVKDEIYDFTAWVKGKDRKTNVSAIEQALNFLSIRDKAVYITNDLAHLTNNSSFGYNLVGGTSQEDFKILLNSKCIISQISGFSVTPFILNKHPQKFILLPKNSHNKDEYQFLEKDWKFFTQILKIVCSKSTDQKKGVILI